MADQLLVNVVSVTLTASATTIVPHGLKVAGRGVVPTQVIPNGPTPIGVLNVNTLGVEFINHGAELASATFRVEYDHSIHAVNTPTVAWGGWSGTAPPVGPAGGDLSGTYPNPTVVKFATKPIDTSAPVAGDYWRFNGTTWQHTLVAPGAQTAIYGAFSSSIDQIIGTTPHVVQFDTTESANGVTLVGGTKLTVTEAGVYGLDISPQLAHSGGGTETITFWLRVDGADVPRSASSLEMGNNNNRTLPFLQIDMPLNAGQYVEWVFVSTVATNLTLEHFPAQTSPPAAFAIPAIPSAIANVKRIGSLP